MFYNLPFVWVVMLCVGNDEQKNKLLEEIKRKNIYSSKVWKVQNEKETMKILAI